MTFYIRFFIYKVCKHVTCDSNAGATFKDWLSMNTGCCFRINYPGVYLVISSLITLCTCQSFFINEPYVDALTQIKIQNWFLFRNYTESRHKTTIMASFRHAKWFMNPKFQGFRNVFNNVMQKKTLRFTGNSQMKLYTPSIYSQHHW